MSNKTATKSSRRDRPKSSDKPRKRRDGTPEKSAISTISQEVIRDDLATRANVIWNDEIEALAIKEDDLAKVHHLKPIVPKPSLPQQSFAVRKVKTPDPSAYTKAKKSLVVAKPAPTDSTLKPLDYGGQAGLRYDSNGNVIPHSILGHYEDFYREALRRGDMVDLPEPKAIPPATPLPKLNKKQPPLVVTTKHMNESNALKHWDTTMGMRKKTTQHVADRIQKPADSLIMATSDQYRDKQELRHLIDRTIPLVDYGKGYRVYSEFWRQQPVIADEDLGIHMTLTQTERGYAPPIEQLGSSNVIKNEKGIETVDTHDIWWDAPYLSQRVTQLGRFIKELRPHKPDFTGLEVVGQSTNPDIKVIVNPQFSSFDSSEKENDKPSVKEENDPLSEYPDVHPEVISGPSISFAGQPARWTGDSYRFCGQTAIEARVAFEVLAGNRVVSKLQVENDGTTSINYSWERVAKGNPFDIHHEKVQRFYFNTSNGVILPGYSTKFPFVFKSSTGGIYTEQWRFVTAPVVCGGADLIVTLRGVAIKEDKHYETRIDIENMLHERQTDRIVTDILDNLVSGVRTPPRSRSPIDAYIMPEEIFSRRNPLLHYHGQQIAELREIYAELCPDSEWDLTVNQIKEACMSLDDEHEERREEILHRLNEIVVMLSFPKFTPLQENKNRIACQLLREAVDMIVGQSMLIRGSMHLPSRDLDEMPEDDKKKGQPKEVPLKKSASKDTKIKSGAKVEAKVTKPLPVKSTPRSQTRLSRPENMQSETPPDPPASPEEKLDEPDPSIKRKYREKLYTQAYLILRDCVEKIADAIDEIHQIENGRNVFDLQKSTT